MYINNLITAEGLGPRLGARRFGPPERAKIDPSRLASRSDGPFRPTKSIQDRSNRHLRSIWPPQTTPRGLQVPRQRFRRAIPGDLGTILGDLGWIRWFLKGRFRSFFDAFALEQANSLEEEATSGKPVKTIGFYRFFALACMRALFENQP